MPIFYCMDLSFMFGMVYAFVEYLNLLDALLNFKIEKTKS